jgi:hypothetical protein
MEGKGAYDRHSLAQHSAGRFGIPVLERALAGLVVPTERRSPLLVADFGAAGGRNELGPMSIAVGALRARAADTPIVVVHTDIPTNDFSTLFETVEHSPDTYLHTPGVYPLAAGRSFYEQILPPESVTLGWSAIAVHWLSRVPTPIPEHVYSSFATGDVRAAFSAQSASDWDAFLRARAVELRDGAALVVVGGAASDDGAPGAEALMDALDRALRRARDAGAITADEYLHMNVPTWNRTLAEFSAPFASGAAATRAGLRLEEHSLAEVPDAYLAAFREDGDAAGFADSVTAFLRAFTEPSLFESLDRPPSERASLAGDVYADVRGRLLADPAAHETVWRVALLRITRSPR